MGTKGRVKAEGVLEMEEKDKVNVTRRTRDRSGRHAEDKVQDVLFIHSQISNLQIRLLTKIYLEP